MSPISTPAARGGTIGFGGEHDQARAAIRQRDGMQPQAQIAARDMAGAQQLIDYAVDGGGGTASPAMRESALVEMPSTRPAVSTTAPPEEPG